ncbi:MAG: NAD(P)/FAD-dependent oxidoreductase [Bacteroidota bacterium]
MEVGIIGGGAAGFFAAISCKQHYPDAQVILWEKSDKLLAKVKISGGGRCNVTHHCLNSSQLSKHYPRGERFLKKAFSQFQVSDTIQWFESRGVVLKTEADNRMFPITDDSQTIIDCLFKEARKLGVEVITKSGVEVVEPIDSGFQLKFRNNKRQVDKLIICTGGSPKISGFEWLSNLGHTIEPPVPSLFTFNMPGESIKELMGVVADDAAVRIQGTKLQYSGPLLITHWGMSGPAILKLSSWGARYLNQQGYNFKAQVNWLGGVKETDLRSIIEEQKVQHSKKKMLNNKPFLLPNRLWSYLMNRIALREDITWGELGSKSVNRLINLLINDIYEVKGKTTFKEEFVTCGGVSLTDIDVKTMESKVVAGMYFAGEVMDIDGITGGFNFQAAWTTGFIAGRLG